MLCINRVKEDIFVSLYFVTMKKLKYIDILLKNDCLKYSV